MPSLFSAISSQMQTKMSDATMKSPSLKEGQVLLGKIKQLHVNQLATVQLGSHQLTAKLEAALENGQSYLFEVETAGETPTLKVIDRSATSNVKDQVMQLFKELGIKPTKSEAQFIEDLINDHVPMNKKDVENLHQLIKQNPSKEGTQVIKEMITKRLPLTETVFNALNSTKEASQSFQQQAVDLLQALRQQPNQSQVLNQLQDKLQTLLKFDQPVSQTKRMNLIEQPTNQMGKANQSIQSQETSDISVQSRSVDINNATAENAGRLSDEQQTLVSRFEKQIPISNKQLFQLNKAINTIEQNMGETTVKQLEQLQNALQSEDVQVKLKAQLPTNLAQDMDRFVASPEKSKLDQLFPELQRITNAQFQPAEKEAIFSKLNRVVDQSPSVFSVKDQFLIHMKDYFQTSGLDYEHQLAQNQEPNELSQPPLKQLLMQALNESGPQVREIETMLNQFTNQQLSTIQDHPNFIHVATQIPGMFGSEQAIDLEFYSRKDEEERIDSNYCRIAFFLELGYIGETMIDMNVQNRMVQVTVYNEEDLSAVLNDYKPSLEKGLDDLNYKLGSVYYKPMPENTNDLMIKPDYQNSSTTSNRLDVKI
ncbi:hypothetical protein SAMN05421734_102153 [Pelagirhabdus alkalitolerans]|uniref:Hook-length control protein FliK n=1 Tax=Pelagirhabdus alkalitolerans TaxID=1612202 RepID=A0A1G6H2X5_9BACI|nr:hypothetical protein [Pelagirhabdus alkalitolerans]SDB88478.1 hypothetical protein SAMN05421734_102153 [Pelagirhabdus alkalitolerans]